MSLFTEDIRVDADALIGGINQWIALKRLSLREGLRKQAGLLADELVKDTPPGKGSVTGKPAGARRVGEARVDREIGRAARPLDPRTFTDKGLSDLIRAKKYGPLQEVFKRFSSDAIVPFNRSVHEQAKDVDGRVTKPTGQATPDFREHAAYVRRIRKNVGIAKGGWVASQIAMGRKPQGWLMRHAWVGECRDNTDGLAGEQSVLMANNSNWAGGRLAGIVMRKAMTRREGRLQRDIAGMLRAASRKAGL